MTIAFDVVSNATPGTGELSWTHTPTGTPRGVLVYVLQYNNGTDQVTGVTYGGTAMTEISGSPALKTSGETGAVYAYYLGTSVPTGAQSVVVSVNATGSNKTAVCCTLTAAANVVVQDSDATISGDSVQNPSVTLSLGGNSCFCAIGLMSGAQTTAGITPDSGWSGYEVDAGNEQLAVYRYGTVGTADVTAGWTQAADDALAIAVALTELDTVDDLTAAGITTGTPVLGAATIGQKHALTSAGVTAGTPVLGAPTLAEATEADDLTAAGITTGVPVLDAPTIGQKHALTSAGITTAATDVDAPTIGQKHALTSAGITTGTPVLDAATIGQKHNLTSADITTAAADVDAPTIGQKHALTANGITTAAPSLGAPTVAEAGGTTDNLTAAGITTAAPSLGAATIGQVHALSGASITTAAPVFDAPTFGQVHGLTSAGVTTSAPVVGYPAIGQAHILSAAEILFGVPVLGASGIGQVHALTAAGITAAAPILGWPSLYTEVAEPPSARTVFVDYSRIMNIPTSGRIVKPGGYNRRTHP